MKNKTNESNVQNKSEGRIVSDHLVSMNHYAHGYVLMLILDCLIKRNVLSEIERHKQISLSELATRCKANDGYLRIALRAAEALGIVRIDGEKIYHVATNRGLSDLFWLNGGLI